MTDIRAILERAGDAEALKAWDELVAAHINVKKVNAFDTVACIKAFRREDDAFRNAGALAPKE